MKTMVNVAYINVEIFKIMNMKSACCKIQSSYNGLPPRAQQQQQPTTTLTKLPINYIRRRRRRQHRIARKLKTIQWNWNEVSVVFDDQTKRHTCLSHQIYDDNVPSSFGLNQQLQRHWSKNYVNQTKWIRNKNNEKEAR